MNEQEKREKIINGLESLHERLLDAAKRDSIAMLDAIIVSDALALLRAQEPVEYVVHCKNADLSNGTEFACGECGGSLLHKRVNYCPWCGREVKWDG